MEADAPDWTISVTDGGGGSLGGYDSLTGAGETATPGALAQAGDLEVTSTDGNEQIWVGSAPGGFGIEILDNGGKGIALNSNDFISIATTGGVQIGGTSFGVELGGGAGSFITIGTASQSLNFFVTGSFTPALKQTVSGSRGGNAALASLLTALAKYGLIVDSSTP
jgi:hypothetical protein